MEETHHISIESANSFEIYCIHSQNPCMNVRADRQTDGHFFRLFCVLRHTKHEHSSKRGIFFSIMRIQYFLFLPTSYVMRK